MSGYCRDVSGEVGFLSGHILRGRLIVVTCSARSGWCRDVIDEVGFVSVRVR